MRCHPDKDEMPSPCQLQPGPPSAAAIATLSISPGIRFISSLRWAVADPRLVKYINKASEMAPTRMARLVFLRISGLLLVLYSNDRKGATIALARACCTGFEVVTLPPPPGILRRSLRTRRSSHQAHARSVPSGTTQPDKFLVQTKFDFKNRHFLKELAS